ncbi:helix-turn-helix transcriptional regulator [Winogradskyella sp.]|uniref:helix-turn-helix transcriptional regulator n=1 Tax=Winogradskyella sp. TaxID=1883156 RepID=UPI003BABA151
MMTIFDYILLVAMAQGYILAFFLLTSRYYRSKANQCLAYALIILSTQSILDILGQFYQTTNPITEFFVNDLSYDFLVYVPLFYFFLLSSKPKASLKAHYYLVLPFIIDSIANLVIVSTYNLEEIMDNSAIQLFYDVEGIVSLLFNLFLCYKSYRLIRNHVNHSASRSHLFRIWNSTLALLVLWIIVTIISLINEDILIVITILYAVIAVWIFWMIYNGVVNLNLIYDRHGIRERLLTQSNGADQQYQLNDANKTNERNAEYIDIAKAQPAVSELKNPSNIQKLSKHFTEMKAVMAKEKLYRDEDLSIEDIAKRFGLSSGYISQIIKKSANKNFPTWINDYRVAEAKMMLSDTAFDNYTILAIGLEAGFKSKSAFYAIFKKTTGLTPSQFRQKES